MELKRPFSLLEWHSLPETARLYIIALEQSIATTSDKIELLEIKTRVVREILKNLATDNVLIIERDNNNLMLSARNLPGVKVMSPEGLNLYDLLYYDKIFITQPCLDDINRRLLV